MKSYGPFHAGGFTEIHADESPRTRKGGRPREKPRPALHDALMAVLGFELPGVTPKLITHDERDTEWRRPDWLHLATLSPGEGVPIDATLIDPAFVRVLGVLLEPGGGQRVVLFMTAERPEESKSNDPEATGRC